MVGSEQTGRGGSSTATRGCCARSRWRRCSGARLPDLARRLELGRRQPGAVRDAPGHRGLRLLRAQDPRLVLLVQGLAPHDLDGYLLQRDRWARGNLAVFTLPESPLRAKELRPLQRLSYFASLFAYLAPPMRLLLLLTLGAVLWTGALPLKISVLALAALWLPSVLLNLGAGAALARGYMRIPETAHYER